MLIECPECGREVSSGAHACPECAYPLEGGSSRRLPASSKGGSGLELTKQILGSRDSRRDSPGFRCGV